MDKVIKTAVKKQKKDKGDKNKRIPCPFCKELILPNAKKCRFCKENLSEEEKLISGKSGFFKKKITPPVPYKFWLLSMVFFLISLTQIEADANSYWFVAMLGSVIVGFIAFFTLLASIPQSKGRYGLITSLTFILFFGALFNYDALASALGLSSQSKNIVLPVSDSEKIIVSPTPTPFKQPSNQATKVVNVNTVQTDKIECIGPDGKQFNTTMEECKKLNEKWGKPVDYMTNCNIHPDCGGGTVYMKKSQCDLPCSGLSNNETSSSKTQEPTSKLNFYCYDNANNYWYYTSSGEQCNLDNIKSACKAVYQSIYDMCADNCTYEAKNISHDCIYNRSEPETTTCLEENSVKHQQCLDSCNNTYQVNVVKCN